MSAENETNIQLKKKNIKPENPKKKKEISFAEKEERSVTISSNEAIYFKVINSQKEFTSFQEFNLEHTFQPLFTIQLFPNELINGYKNLKILISLTPKYFFPHIKISYDRQLELHDDLDKILKEFFGDLYCNDDKIFLSKLNEELTSKEKPKGKLITKENNREIILIDIVEDSFLKQNENYQILFKFFIDGASSIPLETNFWNYYLILENTEDNWITLGFCSSKDFHTEYNKYITMLSQFLIIPKFQRQGIGKFLLKTIYEFLFNDECCTEITTEDPCIEFVLMRDVALSELILKNKFLDTYLKELGKDNEIKTLDLYNKFPIDSEFVTKITKKFKFQKNFILRALELILYSICSKDTVNNFLEYKKNHLKKIIENKHNMGLLSKTPRKGPFIYFGDGTEFNYEEVLEEEKREMNFDPLISQQVEFYFNEYDKDIQCILPKIGKAVLEYKAHSLK